MLCWRGVWFTASASWSESESDPQVPKDLVFAVLNMNPLTRMGRRKRNKVQTHAEYDWYKTRGGQAWLDKLSVHGERPRLTLNVLSLPP